MTSVAALGASSLLAEEPKSRDQLQEPVLRVSKKPDPAAGNAPIKHPLDPALEVAHNSLKLIRDTVTHYTATLVKRERVNGTLNDYEYMFAKIRNRKKEGDEIKVPLAAYMYFLKPDSVKGREVLYVEKENDGKMIAHEGGRLANFSPSVWLAPDGFIAMKGQLYPITEVGIENLVVRLIEKGERDRKRDECQVEFRQNAKINKRSCTLLQVVHPVRRAYFDFNLAQVFIDDELKVPVRYAAYTWPADTETNPNPTPNNDTLLEEYTYLDLKLNPDLGTRAFDYTNPEYNFVRQK